MQNSTLIKENIQKLVLRRRKAILNEVVQSGVLREAFESNKLPKKLTEEQFLFGLSEYLSEDGNFILKNYKILTHPNPTPEMLDEVSVIDVFKAIPWGKVWDGAKNFFKWVWKKVGDTWEWVWNGPPGSVPDVPKPTKPGRIPDSFDDIPEPPSTPKQIGPYDTPNGLPVDEYGVPHPDLPTGLQDPDPNIIPESLSNFNRNMKHLMESNHQIDQNLLHSMLNQVNESKYLLELAIQRNQVNRIIDRI